MNILSSNSRSMGSLPSSTARITITTFIDFSHKHNCISDNKLVDTVLTIGWYLKAEKYSKNGESMLSANQCGKLLCEKRSDLRTGENTKCHGGKWIYYSVKGQRKIHGILH